MGRSLCEGTGKRELLSCAPVSVRPGSAGISDRPGCSATSLKKSLVAPALKIQHLRFGRFF